MEAIQQRLAELEARVAELEQARVIVRPVRERVARAEHAAANLEAKVGTYWLSRLGIVSLITGAALLVITYFGALGPLVRIALGYAMAGGVAWTGWRLSQRHRTFGQIVFGGGLAIAYFVTYALHFVPAMRVVHSEVAGIALVALAIAGIVVVAHRLRSETVAGIALFLGLHTGMLVDVTALSLVATTLLAAGAGFFLAVNRWVIVPLSTVVAVYMTHASIAIEPGGASPGLRLAFVGVAAALFAVASLRHALHGEVRLVRALALLNWVGALVLGAAAVGEVHAFAGGFAFAAAYGVLALVAWLRRAAPAYVVLHVGLAIATLALAMPARLAGHALVAGWLALAVACAVIARRADARFGVLAGLLLVAAYVAAEDTSTLAMVICAATGVAVERLHAADGRSGVRLVLVAGIACALLQIVERALPLGYETLATVAVGALLFAAGFILAAAAYRWAALGVLGVAGLRLLSSLGAFSPDQRILTFVLGGVVLLGVSYVYSRRSTA